MRQKYWISTILLVIFVILASGCKREKDVSDMSPEEKIALEIDGESALSPKEKAEQQAARSAILDRARATERSEEAMASALKDARDVLPADLYTKLEVAQNFWKRQGRGQDINNLVKQGIAPGDAFARANMDRADFIQQRTSRIMLMMHQGLWGGYYTTVDKREIELYEMPENRLNLVLRSQDGQFVVTASGTYDAENRAKLCSERQPDQCLAITRLSDGILMIEPSEQIAKSADSPIKAMMEGQFERQTMEHSGNVFDP